MVNPEMYLKQISLEEEIRDISVRRFYSTHEKAGEAGEYASTVAGRNLMSFLLDKFIPVVDAYTIEQAGKPRRRPRAYNMLHEFGDNRAACYIFLKRLIDGIHMYETRGRNGHKAKRSTVVLEATDAIHDEYRLRFFEQNYRSLMRVIVKDHNKRDLTKGRRKELFQREFKKQKCEWRAEGWGTRERLQLGITMLELLNDATGFISEYSRYVKNRATAYITVAEPYVKQIEEKMEKSSLMKSICYPTVIPPRPWVNGEIIGGGFYSQNVAPYPLVKRCNSKFVGELENRDMTKIMTAVNALQETPWRVNEVMVDAVEFAYTSDLGIGGIPLSNPEPLPEPPAAGFKDKDEENAFKHTRFTIRDRNRRAMAKRVATLRTIGLGRKFAEYPAIYFPHDLDSRGRAYPKVPFMNPQGPDYAKAMIEFAEGKPIETEEHAAYLAVAIANAWGQDKLPLQDRVEWVQEHEEMLLSVAQDYREDRRWTQADEPFMALRGALEWAALAEHGPGYLSHMPVHFDATCSGLQHFSALLRDAEGGFHVNLTSAPERQDIYGAVAAKAKASLEKIVDDPERGTYARIALDLGITRALCKRPVMIVPYSGTFKAAMGYIEDYYRDSGLVIPLDDKEFIHKFIPTVTTHVWEAINSTVIAARDAMDWITKVAKTACTDSPKVPLQWETPDGFVCRQAVYDLKPISVETFLEGRGRVQVQLFTELKTLDGRKMSQSISPNYIHSMDACHLRMSILRGLEIGITDYAMIHDSFGVHASEMPRFLEECVKPAFIDMYKDGDNLNKFRRELLPNIKDETSIPPLPRMGALDINEVQDSEFFFS